MHFRNTFLLTALLCLSYQVHGLEVKIGVFSDQLPLIQKLTGETRCPPITPSQFGENQMIAEYLLVCNILNKAHPSLSIELVPYPVAKRIVDAVARSEVDLSGFGVWKNEASQPGVLISSPLLNKGEFSKGLYALPQRAKQIDWFNSTARHSKLIVVANMNWTNDWKALGCTKLNRVHVGQYEQMFKMLALGRTDILTMAFGSDPQLIREEFGIELHPIIGIKLEIDQSSHILVSSNSKNALALLNDINSGLTQLREQGVITQMYRDVGVTNPIVSDWVSLCNSPQH